MLSRMASQWRTLQRIAEHLVFSEAPKLLRQLQNPQVVQRTIQQGILGIGAIIAGAVPPEPRTAITAGRPVTSESVPSAHRARRVVYEDDPSRGKDRPVLVVGRDRRRLLGLMLSSQAHHDGEANWLSVGVGSWDYEGRPSWIRLDRVLDVPEEGIRREGAIMDRATFELVAMRLRAEYSWS